jgi:hypothetical protein
MEARKLAAQFAAYTWFENTQAGQADEDAKARFAKENWQQFLPIAQEGLGRLLLKIAAGRPSKRRNRRMPTAPKLAAAG